jgi:hypothetical protein
MSYVLDVGFREVGLLHISALIVCSLVINRVFNVGFREVK